MRLRWPRSLAGLAAVALGVGAGASADTLRDPVGELRRCASIADTAPRLACFDELAARAAQAPAREPPAAKLPAASAEPARPSPQDFGLSPAQRPPVEELPSITARVLGLGRSANGRPTVQLDNGQLWELDADDPLLAAGESVTIRRGPLGSFRLRTAAQRTHFVRRLR